jgi:hypothetical protein
VYDVVVSATAVPAVIPNVTVPFPTVNVLIVGVDGTAIVTAVEGALLPVALVATTARLEVARALVGVKVIDVATWFVVVATTVPTAFTTL